MVLPSRPASSAYSDAVAQTEFRSGRRASAGRRAMMRMRDNGIDYIWALSQNQLPEQVLVGLWRGGGPVDL